MNQFHISFGCSALIKVKTKPISKKRHEGEGNGFGLAEVQIPGQFPDYRLIPDFDDFDPG